MNKRTLRAAIALASFSVALITSSVGQPYDPYAAAIANSTPPSRAVRAAIVEAARNLLFDPYSVRDAQISNVADFGNGTQGVCVLANSKNRFGGYTGRQSHAITMSGIILLKEEANHPLCARPDIKWHAFPELEAL